MTRFVRSPILSDTTKIKQPEPTLQPFFDDEQIEQILANARPLHDTTFLLLAETGFRFGEAQRLIWSDVDFSRL